MSYFWILGNLVKEVFKMYQYVFANNLCRLCKERNINITQFAEAIDKSPRQVNRYRNAQCENISLSTMEKIANVLQVHIIELLH